MIKKVFFGRLFFCIIDAPSQEMVERWLAVGDVQNLEQLVLDGRSHMLIDKSSMNLASAEFLDGVPQYQVFFTLIFSFQSGPFRPKLSPFTKRWRTVMYDALSR